jgi:hypothetical protein
MKNGFNRLQRSLVLNFSISFVGLGCKESLKMRFFVYTEPVEVIKLSYE